MCARDTWNGSTRGEEPGYVPGETAHDTSGVRVSKEFVERVPGMRQRVEGGNDDVFDHGGTR